MLDQDFYDGSLKVTIRIAFKILEDEFICRYDDFNNENRHRLSWSDIFMTRVRNPYQDQI